MLQTKTTTQVKYPIGGYAPGSYYCTCSTCKEMFLGDKRAVQCEPCAINTMKDALSELCVKYDQQEKEKKERYKHHVDIEYELRTENKKLRAEITELTELVKILQAPMKRGESF